jgi:hypothetical protein
MSNKENTHLTSTKIPEKLFEDFKVMTVRTKFTLQKLTERSIYLYLTNDDFRKMIHNQLDTTYTGSI